MDISALQAHIDKRIKNNLRRLHLLTEQKDKIGFDTNPKIITEIKIIQEKLVQLQLRKHAINGGIDLFIYLSIKD